MVSFMKNQNGFTLIELLVTIGLMVLVGVLVANNLTSIFSKREDENISDFEETLITAACTYIDLSDPEIKLKKEECKKDGCTVNTSVLVLNGLLEEDLINPLTKKSITGSETISIHYPSGEKTCTYHAE